MKFKGIDVINRTTDLMQSMKTSNKKANVANVESSFFGHDGKHYAIVRESSAFVLKVSDNLNAQVAEDFDYIGGLKNREKYTAKSITEIQRRFNIMDIESKRKYGESLINESQKLSEKYVLKLPNQNNIADISFPEMGNKKKNSGLDQNSDAGLDSDFGGDESLDSGMDDFEMNDSSEMDSDKPSDNPDDYKDVDEDSIGGDVTEKNIQQLAGKLAYQLRQFDDETYSDTAKFAMSMATSAVQSDKVDDEDKADIVKKIEKKFGENSEEDGSEGLADEQDPKGNLDSEEDNNEINMKDFSNETFVRLKDIIENYNTPKKSRVIKEDMYAAPSDNNLGGKTMSKNKPKQPTPAEIEGIITNLYDVFKSSGKPFQSFLDAAAKRVASWGGDLDVIDFRIMLGMNKSSNKLRSLIDYIVRHLNGSVKKENKNYKGRNLSEEDGIPSDYRVGGIYDAGLKPYFKTIFDKRDRREINTNRAAIEIKRYLNDKFGLDVDSGDIGAKMVFDGVDNLNDWEDWVNDLVQADQKRKKISMGESDAPFNKKMPKMKNKREYQDWFGYEVGRYFGNDDAMKGTQDSKEFFGKLKNNTKKNPFRY